jgi:hypothetical protein
MVEMIMRSVQRLLLMRLIGMDIHLDLEGIGYLIVIVFVKDSVLNSKALWVGMMGRRGNLA